MDAVLILGAGLMQIPAIKSAKELGFYTALVDADKNAVGVPLCDEFSPVDLKDKEGIFNFAKKINEKHSLKGVFTAGTDFSSSVSYVAEKLSLPCHSFESSLNASIKNRMRECFKKNSVPSPEFISLSEKDFLSENSFLLEKSSVSEKSVVAESSSVSENRIIDSCKKLGFPCVVKPVDNMGARGCRMIRSEEEVLSSVKNAFSASRSKTVILESYMEGAEYSIDALLYNGTMTITGFADRHIYFPPYFIETGHTMPSRASSSVKKELFLTFAKAVSSLGLTTGAAKADIKFTKNGAMVGEIAARLSGGYMSGWTFPYASNLNLTKEALLIATGRTPETLIKKRVRLYKNEECPFALYEIPVSSVSAERAWISIPGVIKEISGIEEAKKVPFVKDVLPRNFSSGSSVDFPRNNVQKCGNVISLCKNYKKAVLKSEKACSSILLRLEANNKETESFLQGKILKDEKGFPPNAFSFANNIKNIDFSKFPVIQKGKSVLSYAKKNPELKKLLSSSEKSFEYRTLKEDVILFDKICFNHPELDSFKFWSALFRGGLQGAIYISDSKNLSEK